VGPAPAVKLWERGRLYPGESINEKEGTVRRTCYNPEDSESARRIKRFIGDQLFEKKLQIKEAAAKVNLTSERLYKYVNEAATNNNS